MKETAEFLNQWSGGAEDDEGGAVRIHGSGDGFGEFVAVFCLGSDAAGFGEMEGDGDARSGEEKES